MRAEVGSWLPELLALLPQGYREAVELADLQGLPQRGVARCLGLSLLDRRGNPVAYARRVDARGCTSC